MTVAQAQAVDAPVVDTGTTTVPASPEVSKETEIKTSNKSFEDMTSADLMNMSDEELAAIEAELNKQITIPQEVQNQLPPTAVNQNGQVVDSNKSIDSKILEEVAKATGQPLPAQPPALPAQDVSPSAPVEPEHQTGDKPLTDAEKIAFLTGQIQAMQNRMDNNNTQPQNQPANDGPNLQHQKQSLETTITNLDANHEAERIKLGQMVDDGEINMVEFMKRDRELQKNVDGIKNTLNARLVQINEQLTAPDPYQLEQQILANPALKEWTNQLELQNPWINHLTGPMIQQLQIQAKADMEAMGLNTKSVEGVYNLRVRVVQLGKEMGYEQAFSPLVQASRPAPTGGNAATAAALPAHTSLQNMSNLPTPAQREHKLDLAANHPPSITSAGTPMPTDALATAHLEGMSPAQLAAALPSSTLDKLGEIA